MSGRVTGRVGVSPVSDHLGHTSMAARRARLALSALRPGVHQVAVYGDHPLATLVASAPETSRDVGRTVLAGVLAVSEEDRRTLLDTLDVWCRAGGNVNRTAELLYCHRNTVRHRLARVQSLTGQSLAEPIGVAETLIAVEAYRLGLQREDVSPR